MIPLPDGVTIEEYRTALASDILGTARKLVAACRASGQRHEEFELVIRQGNELGSWIDSEGNPFPLPVLQLLRDCETRWSSTFLLLDRVLTLLPVRASQQPKTCSNLVYVHRQSRCLPLARNRPTASCHRLCSAKQKLALRSIFAKSLKFRTLPKSFSPPTGRQHSLSPFQSLIGSFLSGSRNNRNIPSYLRPSRWGSQNSRSILRRHESPGYMPLQSVCSAKCVIS